MKFFLLFSLFIISFNSYSQGRMNNRPLPKQQQGFTIYTPSGPMRYTSPYQYEQDSLAGNGVTFVGYAKIKEGVISVWNRDCKDMVIGDLNKETDEALKSRLGKIKSGQQIRFKMEGSRSCKVFAWE